MRDSKQWKLYFEENARSLIEIPWDLGGELTPEEKAAIGRSVQEFQAGESSEGRHLYRYAQEYAERTGDVGYVQAIRLFIAEEQRHGQDLGRFLTLNQIPLLRTTFTDRVFRKLRNVLGGLESSIAVLLVAEIISMAYYPLLRRATKSRILQCLCDQIIRDEEMHVRFQAGQLAKLRANQGWLKRALAMGLQRFLFFGTVLVVWLCHRHVIRRGGLSLLGWWRACWRAFERTFSPSFLASSPSLLHSEEPMGSHSYQ